MSRFAVDTNVLVALSRADHPDNLAATAEIERRLRAGDLMVVPAHVLMESYSVLTRLPPPFRLTPADAVAVIRELVRTAEIATLEPHAYMPVLQQAATANVRGGQIHDALIAATSAGSGAEVVLTFNTRHFATLGFDLDVRQPRP